MKVVVGITGASGSIYAHRLIAHLKNLNCQVEVICTTSGEKVSHYEHETAGFDLCDKRYSIEDYFAPVASGSYTYDALVILPASMGTLGKIANGIADNLLCRAADVRIKEKGKCLIVPREMPLSPIHLENMLKLSRLGVTLIPASPHFYHHPKNINDLVDTVLARVLDHIGIPHQIGQRWGEK